MLSDPCLASLRMAAVLAYRLPVGLRIGALALGADPDEEADPMLAVSRPPAEPDPRARWLPPCAFRAAVIDAWRMHRDGHHLAFCGARDGAEVVIDVDVPPGGETLPFGMYQVPWGDEILFAFATGADAELCRDAANPLGVAVHTDGALEVNLVHLATEPERIERAFELIVTSLARISAEEVVAETERGRAGRLD